MHIAIETLTWSDIEVVGRDKKAIGLVPLGALEQHGPHLPLGTDTLITRRLAEALSESLNAPVVVTPTIDVGLSDHHTAFPGTVTIEAGTYGRLVSAYIDGLRSAGLTQVGVFSHHGGNFKLMTSLANDYRSAAVTGFAVAAYDNLSRYLTIEQEAVRFAGGIVSDADAHAGLVETSLMLHLAGDLCRDHRSIGGYEPTDDAWLERVMNDGIQTVSPTGVLGSPAGATEAIGCAIFMALTSELATWLESAFLIPASNASTSTGTTA